MNKIAAAVKCESYDPALLKETIAEAWKLSGGIDCKGKKVLLKPNILSASRPDKAVTTHPEFVKQCVLHFKSLGAEVYAGDSPGYHTSELGGKKSGIKAAAEEAGAVWDDFSESVTVKNPSGKLVKSFKLATIVNKVDIIVSLPKMKTHQLLFQTGGMKNLFGLIPGFDKAHYHLRFPDRMLFARMIVDLNIAVKPSFVIMDCITAMEGPGPGSGTPRQAGVIIASSNLLAADITAARIMNYDPEKMPVIKEALETKKWLESVNDVVEAGEPVSSLVVKDFKKIHIPKDISMVKKRVPGFVYKLARKFVILRPVVYRRKCIECGYCVRICPANAMTLTTGRDSRVIIDYGKCINCYCCHEICPAKAISVKRRIFS